MMIVFKANWFIKRLEKIILGNIKMANDNLKYYLISGYGWSGSSALVDMLKEYQGTLEPSVEFRIIKDPCGLHDLYDCLINKWDPLNTDIAIKRFVWFINRMNKTYSRFSLHPGFGYEKYFGDRFLQQSLEFVDNICEFDYDLFWWYMDFIKEPLEMFKKKLRKLMKTKVIEKAHFSAISRKDFIFHVQNYIDSLFTDVIGENNQVILDQAISIIKYEEEMQFIRNGKLIVVDRDPRDIYADLMEDGNMLGKDLQRTHDVWKYVKWHKAWRQNIDKIKSDSNILYIRFEDLIYKYDETERIIEEFLRLDHSKHVQRKIIFNPAASKKNVQMWRNLLSVQEIETIERELKEYLYYD